VETPIVYMYIVMKYNVYDLGQLKRGDRVQVTLSGNAANMRLAVLGVPRSAHWYVTVDLQGLRGNDVPFILYDPMAL
jgi:hypothetical protein